MRSVYKIIKTEEQVDQLIRYILETRYCSFDFETSSLKYYEESEYPTILGISFQVGSAWIVPLGHYDSPFRDFYKRVLLKFKKPVFENPNIIKIAWNAKFEFKWLRRFGIGIMGRLFCAMLAKYPLDEERPHGLKENTDLLLPDFAGYGLKGSGSDKFNWARVPLEELSKYCGLDCDTSFRMFLFYESRLIDRGFYPIYRNMFCMLVRVLGKMEFEGMPIDEVYLDSTIVRYRTMIQENEDKLRESKKIRIYQKYKNESRKEAYLEKLRDERDYNEEEGNTRAFESLKTRIRMVTLGNYSNKTERGLEEPINFGSPPQMADLLYNSRKGFRLECTDFTDSGAPSTAEETLLKFRDKVPFIDDLLKYRELQKLDSTYISGIKSKVSSKGLIHCNYKINGTVTGRLSSTEPNMQNVPRMTTNPDIKPMFIPKPGYLWFELDYSQAELRIVAELAKEQQMIDWFNAGHNIHVAVAAMANKVEYEYAYPITKDENHPDHKFWTKQKKRAKTINFGILYEQGPPKLAETLKCSVQEASEFRDLWLSMFPRIAKWIDGQHKRVKRDGYVTNMFGFKRRLPNIYSPKYGQMLEAQRQSVNSPIQGAASFFTLFSAIVIEEYRMLGEIPLDFPLTYTVHDSIGGWVKPDKVHELFQIAIPICANPQTQDYFGFQLKYVKMKASAEIGTNWGNKKDYNKNADYTKLLNP